MIGSGRKSGWRRRIPRQQLCESETGNPHHDLRGSVYRSHLSVFTASFLYFKLFNDLQQDQRHYHSLSKIGLSEKEMKRSATIQIALLFYIPLIFAALQTLVGLWGFASIFISRPT